MKKTFEYFLNLVQNKMINENYDIYSFTPGSIFSFATPTEVNVSIGNKEDMKFDKLSVMPGVNYKVESIDEDYAIVNATQMPDGETYQFSIDSIFDNVIFSHNEKIKKVDGEYAVYPKRGGKRLGTHKSKKGALAQLAAIEISKKKHNELFSFSDDDHDTMTQLLPEEDEAVKYAVKNLNKDDIEEKGDIYAKLSEYLKSIGFQYPSMEDYEYGMDTMCDMVLHFLGSKEIYDSVETIEEFKKYRTSYKGEPTVGSEWTVHYGAPATGSTTYRIEKIENGKIYSNIVSDTKRELGISDVI